MLNIEYGTCKIKKILTILQANSYVGRSFTPLKELAEEEYANHADQLAEIKAKGFDPKDLAEAESAAQEFSKLSKYLLPEATNIIQN